jgi:hypothetical protein
MERVKKILVAKIALRRMKWKITSTSGYRVWSSISLFT